MIEDAIFEVFTAVMIPVEVFWVAEVTLKMAATRPYETSVSYLNIARRHNPGGKRLE
jgi:hypothetical protein